MSTRRYTFLNADNALIWRIVHRENISWLIEHGLHCANTGVRCDDWVTIGCKELIGRRNTRDVPIAQQGTLNDYVPFYFTPYSMMAYNIHTGYNVPQVSNENIIILVASLSRLQANDIDFTFTNMHAYLQLAEFYTDMADLNNIDWDILQRRDFMREDGDPQKTDRYQAEALIYQHLPIKYLDAIICYSDKVKVEIENELKQHRLQLKVVVNKERYFSV